MKRFSIVAIVAFVCFLPLLMAPTGGFPSRPTFSKVSIRGGGTDGERMRIAAFDAVGDNYIQFKRSNGSTNQGFVGFGGGLNDNFTISNEVANANVNILTSGTGGFNVNTVSMTPEAADSVLTLTGCTTSPTTTAKYMRIGNQVTLYSGAGMTCTSNSGVKSLGTLPASVRPATNRCVGYGVVSDSVAGQVPVVINISTAGVVDFTLMVSPFSFGCGAGNNHTTTGSFQLQTFNVSYMIN